MTLTLRMSLQMPQQTNSSEDHPGFLVALEQDEQQLVLDYGDVELFEKWQS